MSKRAYRVDNAVARRIPLDEALSASADLVWVHLGHDEGHDAGGVGAGSVGAGSVGAGSGDSRAWLTGTARLPGYVVDALTAAETRPRLEAVADGALLNLRGRSSAALDTGDLLASVRIWALAGRVWSVTKKPMIAVEQVAQEVEANRVKDPGDLITAFAGAITADLDPVVAALGDELDDCEESLDAKQAFALRRAVSRVRAEAIGYKRFLAPQRTALERLAVLPGDWLGDDDRLHLSAAADRAARMAEELEAIRERSALIHETLTDLRAEQIDQRGLTISVVAMIFLPLTFITGLYGMNVQNLPYAREPWAFDAIMAACAAITAGVVIWFLRRHWFRG